MKTIMSDTKKLMDVFNGRSNKTIHKTLNLKLKIDVEKRKKKEKKTSETLIYVNDAAQGGWNRKKC